MKIEQVELRDAARQILQGAGQASDADAAWAAIRDAGFIGVSAPEAAGGLAQPLSAACWLNLESGHALSSTPLLPALLAVEALAACPESESRDLWLTRVIAGAPLAISLREPSAGVSTADALNGTVFAVQSAGRASHLLLAGTAPAIVAVVSLTRRDVRVLARRLWDETRDLADVILSAVPHEDVDVLARGDAAEAVVTALSVHLHAAIAADCLGAAEALLDQTVAYLKTRRQFDRPLAMFQALKHRCADLRTEVSAADALLSSHVGDIERGAGDSLLLAKAAKSIASVAFRTVAEEAVQLHGGIGMTAEHPCHRYLKRALLNEQLASPDDACDLAVAEGLLRAANA